MEEERIKSAFEIAMEKISGLPELTPEEIAEQAERRYGPVGEAIAGKYLSGFLDEDELLAELGKHKGDEAPIVRRGLISSLCGMLNLEVEEGLADRAMAGLARLEPGKREVIGNTASRFRTLVREFEQERQKRLENFGALSLGSLGISGSAVKVNPDQNLQWQEEMRDLQQACEPRLESLRSVLLRELMV